MAAGTWGWKEPGQLPGTGAAAGSCHFPGIFATPWGLGGLNPESLQGGKHFSLLVCETCAEPCHGIAPPWHHPTAASPLHGITPLQHHPIAASPLHSITHAEPARPLPGFPSSTMSWGRPHPPLTHPAGGCRAVPHGRAGNLGRAGDSDQGRQTGGRRGLLLPQLLSPAPDSPRAPMGAAEAISGGCLPLPPSAWGGQGTAGADQGHPVVVDHLKGRCWVRPEAFGLLWIPPGISCPAPGRLPGTRGGEVTTELLPPGILNRLGYCHTPWARKRRI